MNKKIFFVVALLVALLSCNNKKTVPNTDIDVARAFIRDILDNNFTDAKTLMVVDETNNEYFDVAQKKFNSFGQYELDNYKNADIIVNEISNVNDSVTIVNYSNSYKHHNADKVKVIRVNGKWLVDLKYTFSGNM
ncbi:MAG: hypothetical protein WDM71_08305 [Ferruginibacter sp.]